MTRALAASAGAARLGAARGRRWERRAGRRARAAGALCAPPPRRLRAPSARRAAGTDALPPSRRCCAPRACSRPLRRAGQQHAAAAALSRAPDRQVRGARRRGAAAPRRWRGTTRTCGLRRGAARFRRRAACALVRRRAARPRCRPTRAAQPAARGALRPRSCTCCACPPPGLTFLGAIRSPARSSGRGAAPRRARAWRRLRARVLRLPARRRCAGARGDRPIRAGSRTSSRRACGLIASASALAPRRAAPRLAPRRRRVQAARSAARAARRRGGMVPFGRSQGGPHDAHSSSCRPPARAAASATWPAAACAPQRCVRRRARARSCTRASRRARRALLTHPLPGAPSQVKSSDGMTLIRSCPPPP